MTEHRSEAAGTRPAPGARNPTERVLAAAIAAIDEGGEANVKVQQIADTAGVQMPVLYRKFGSRDGLIQAAQIARLSGQLEREVTQIGALIERVDSAEEFDALLEMFFATLCSPSRRDSRLQRFNIIGSTSGRPGLTKQVSDAQGRAIANIAGLFRRPQERGWIRPDLDLEAFAAWLAGATLGRMIIELDGSGEFPAWDAIFADSVRHILLPPGDAARADPDAGDHAPPSREH